MDRANSSIGAVPRAMEKSVELEGEELGFRLPERYVGGLIQVWRFA